MAINRNTPNDISDTRPDAGNSPELSPTQLPIRGEKRIIPSPVSAATLSGTLGAAYLASGKLPPSIKPGYVHGAGGRTQLVEPSDFLTAAALEPFVDYVIIRLQHRGINAAKQSDGSDATFRFLINPAQVAISRTTLDGQVMTRAGWQIGVWGEDVVQVTLSGKTAGQYFAFGITDKYQQFTESYRNLEQLQMVFENNGYFFEGEVAAEGPLAADFARRRIKMQEDVELIVGNFMWYGMFDTLTITQSADEPWLASFNIVFTAWIERYRPSSPYQQQIRSGLQRGHSYSAWASSTINNSHGVPSNANTPANNLPPTQPAPTVVPNTTAPAVTQAQADMKLPQGVDPTSVDSSPMQNVLYRTEPQFVNYWTGVK
jgi:hypothetical protein